LFEDEKYEQKGSSGEVH